MLLCSILSPVRWCYCLYMTVLLGCVQKPFSSSSSHCVPCFHCSPISGFWKGTCCHSTFTALHGVSAARVFNTQSVWRGLIHLGKRGGERTRRSHVEHVLVCDSRYFSVRSIHHLLKSKSASPQPLKHVVCQGKAVPFSQWEKYSPSLYPSLHFCRHWLRYSRAQNKTTHKH